MRLDSQQTQGIFTALDPYLSGESASLFLYGSRVRDDLKGGDIDLLLLANTDSLVKQLRSEKHILLSQIKKYIGDQKIDITIANQTDTTTDPFLKIITSQAILLHQWK